MAGDYFYCSYTLHTIHKETAVQTSLFMNLVNLEKRT